VLKKLFIEE